jgi:acyl dehydratase
MRNPLTVDDFTPGQDIPAYKVLIPHRKYRKYNRLIKEINPLHFNKNYAQKLGFDDIVVAGNFLFTYIPKWIIDWIGRIEVIKNVTITFENPVYINEKIIHEGKIISIEPDEDGTIIQCDYTVKKPDGLLTATGTILLKF